MHLRINDSGRPWSLVFTKLDAVELGRTHPLDNMEHCLETIERLTASTLSFIPTCSHTGLGKDGLLKYISGLRQAFKMPLVFK
jgi:predicted AAA+ superfamily ATPase